MAVYQIGEAEYEIDDSITGSQLTDILNKLAQSHKEEIRPSFSEGLVRSFNQGLYFGFADEVEASANAAIDALKGGDFGESYNNYLSQIRETRKQFTSENPYTATGAEILGSVGTGAAGGLKLASKLPQTAGAFTRGAVVGAPSGALAGAGMADPDEELSFFESMKERVFSAGKGAAIGGALGGTVGKAAEKAGPLIESAAARTRGAFVGAKSKALRQLSQAMDRDSTTLEKMIRKKSLMGEEANISDIGGENVRDLLETIAQQPGKARDRVRRAMIGRLQTQRVRLKDSIRGLVHPQADDLDTARSQIEQNLKTQAKPLYEQAYNSPININDEIKGILERPKIKPLLNKAVQMAKSDTDLPAELSRGLDPEKPNVVLLDYLKKAIDDRVRVTKGNERRIFSSAAEKLRGEVDKQVPVYEQARKIFGDEAKRLEALELGQSVFKDSKKGVNVEKIFENMTPEQKEMFRLGSANEMFRIMDNVSDTLEGRPGSGLINKIYSTPIQKRTVDMIMESPQAARNFRRMLEAERSYVESANKALSNSSTARRLAQQADQAMDVSEAAEIASGRISGFLNAAKRILSGKGPDEIARSELGRILTTQNVDDIRSILESSRLQGSLLPESLNKALSLDSNALGNFIRSNPNMVLDQLSITTGTLAGGE